MAYRLEALSRLLFEWFPPSLEPFYVAVTWFGDTVVLIGLLSVLYWARDRRRGILTVVSYAFVGLATVVAFKGLFAAPRPSVALVDAYGYGFPSGHSLGAIVIYGALAREFGWLENRRTYAAVAVFVAAIAASRLALRVHYLGDVLVGLAVGIAILSVVPKVTDDDPRRAFAVAGLVGALAVVMTGGSPDSVAAVAGSLAGVLVTSLPTLRESFPALSSRAEGVALTAVGLPLVGIVKVGTEYIPAFPGVAGLDEFIIVVVVVLLPVAFQKTGIAAHVSAAADGA